LGEGRELMAEIWPRPTNKQKQNIIDLLDDNLIFSAVSYMINDYFENKDCDLRKKYNKWQLLTKSLIREGKASFLTVELEKIIYQIADEQNSEENIKQDLKSQRKEFETQVRKIYAKDVQQIVKQVKITDLAKKYGLKLKGNKCICPFHTDKSPSLTFNDSKGVFHCFGCQESGNILTFIKKMEEINDNKRRSETKA
jgi:hypothetical protein